jgi:chemotaxis protein MotB
METHGVRADQVAQVRGFAERQLRHPQDPESPSNRRISVIVQYLTPPAGPAKAPAEAGKAPAAEAGKAPAATARRQQQRQGASQIARKAKDRSTVRQHWENNGPAPART